MAKDERAKWFKMFLHQKALIDSVPDETAGKALKAAFRYFDSKEMDDLDPLTFAVFSVIKPYIDESFSDYQRSVESGRSGGQKRWSKEAVKGDSPPIVPPSYPIGESTEADTEAEADREANVYKGNERPKRTRFIPPTVDEVRDYCQENGYRIDSEYFIDYYTANDWMVGNNKMSDWKAVVRNWNRREQEKNPPADKKKHTLHDLFPPVPTI